MYLFRHLAEITETVAKRLEQIPRETRIRFWHHTTMQLYWYLAYRKI